MKINLSNCSSIVLDVSNINKYYKLRENLNLESPKHNLKKVEYPLMISIELRDKISMQIKEIQKNTVFKKSLEIMVMKKIF